MKPKQIVKACADAAMTLGLLFLMGYHLWGDTAHECFLLMAAHLGLHWGMLLGMVRTAGKIRFSGKPVSPLPAAAGALTAVYGAAAEDMGQPKGPDRRRS